MDRPIVRSAGVFAEAWGMLLTVVALLGIEILREMDLVLPNPAPIFLAAVVYAAFSGGMRSGLLSAGLVVAYSVWFFSEPGGITAFNAENRLRVLLLAVCAPLIAMMVGKLRASTLRAADLAREHAVLEARMTERTRYESSLRENEERLRAIVDTALDAVITMDTGGFITGWNPQAERIFGWQAKEVLGLRMEHVVVPAQHRENHRRGLARFLETGESRVLNQRIEITAINRSGDEFPVELAISLGKVAGTTVFSAFVRDITERRRNEEALRAKAEELARSNHELEQFAYVASHDLQEPLRMVTSYLDLLQRRYAGQFDDKATSYMNFVMEGAGRMHLLISDLLAFSRLGHKPVVEEQASSEAALQDALGNLHAAIDETKAEIVTGLMPRVWIDRVHLMQVFQNLIGNALKFRGSQPPKIEVRAEPDRHAWRFSVRDNGIGIAPLHYERIFVIFQRLHTRGQYPGNGIGLALCKKIVENIGGRIWVESTPGAGAAFFFTVPNRPQTMVLGTNERETAVLQIPSPPLSPIPPPADAGVV